MYADGTLFILYKIRLFLVSMCMIDEKLLFIAIFRSVYSIIFVIIKTTEILMIWGCVYLFEWILIKF